MRVNGYPNNTWNTSIYYYKKRRIIIQSQRGRGIKAHVFLPNSMRVDFTFRYHFISPKELLQKAKAKIDKKGN